jgi:hypothetical protein
MSNVINLKKQVELNHAETLKALGVSRWNEMAYEVHCALTTSVNFILDPIRSLFDSTPTLSDADTRALYEKGGTNMLRLEAERSRANYRG